MRHDWLRTGLSPESQENVQQREETIRERETRSLTTAIIDTSLFWIVS